MFEGGLAHNNAIFRGKFCNEISVLERGRGESMKEKKYRRVIVPCFTIEHVHSADVNFLCGGGGHIPIQG